MLRLAAHLFVFICAAVSKLKTDIRRISTRRCIENTICSSYARPSTAATTSRSTRRPPDASLGPIAWITARAPVSAASQATRHATKALQRVSLSKMRLAIKI